MTQDRSSTPKPMSERPDLEAKSTPAGRDAFGGRETVPPSRSVETETRPRALDQSEALMPESEAGRFHERWVKIQANFVDEPRKAVRDAQQLLDEVFQAMNSAFTKSRNDLEAQWERSGEASTEDLRQAVRRYKVLFERLLAA